MITPISCFRSNYGALLEITSNDFHKFKDAYGSIDREVFSPSVYYPNNVVIGRLPPLDRVTNLTPDIAVPSNYKRRSLVGRNRTPYIYYAINWGHSYCCLVSILRNTFFLFII